MKMSSKQGRNKVVLVVALVGLLIGLLGTHTFAADKQVVVALPVEQTFTQTGTSSSVSKTFRYLLTANQEGNPMPKGASTQQYEFSLEGDAKENLPPITFTMAGTFEYTLKQIADTTKGYTYDTQEYTISIYVLDDGDKLIAQTLLPIGDGSKHEKIIFMNSYQLDPTATPPGVTPTATPGSGKPTGGGITPTSSGAKSSGIVKTGDTTNLLFWVEIGGVALLLLISLYLLKQRKRN